MENQSINPLAPSGGGRGKGNDHYRQKQTIFNYLQSHIATASMVTAATGVPQKCICRYKRDLEKAGRLWGVRKGICRVTGHRAWYLTTDPDRAPFNRNAR